MSLNMSKQESRTAADDRLKYVKDNTRPDSAPHQYATDEIAFRHRKRMLSLGLKYSLVTAVVVGCIYVLSRIIV
jgi:hypothetical protein